MGYFLIWLFFGIFSALVASKKNRNIVGWFFIGLLFGPFGLLFAFFMKDLNDVSDEKKYIQEVKNAGITDHSSHEYEIKSKNNTSEEWNELRKIVLNSFASIGKIIQNDNDNIKVELSKNEYISLSKSFKKDGMYYHVTSKGCGPIEFGNNFEYVDHILNEDTETKPLNIHQDNTVEKLSKLSELLDKGHITQEEFNAQKAKILNT